MLAHQALQLTSCVVDLDRCLVERDGETFRLRTKEAELLAYLAARDGETVPRDELLTAVWGYRPGMVTRTIDNTVRRLRMRIEAKADDPDHVITVYGTGYRFVGATPSTHPPAHALPQYDTRFFGRQDSLADLAALLAHGGLVSVVGLAGVGKSRLAVEAARAGEHPVVYVDLADAVDLPSALAAVEAALGLPHGTQIEATLNTIGATLATRPDNWLFLDNVEGVVGLLGPSFAAWSKAATVLVTSRTHVETSARTLVLEALQAGDAVALFCDRVAGIRADFQASDAQLQALVGTTGGLPLALEMAAAATAALSAQQIVEAGARALRGHRTSGRHATLARAFTTTWDQLEAKTAALLSACSVFAAPFDLAAITALVDGTDEEVLPMVEAAIRHPLLCVTRQGRAARYHLAPAFKPFVADQIRDPAPLHLAHASWVTRATAGLRPALRRGDRSAIARLEPLRHDLRAAAEREVPGPLAAEAALTLSQWLQRRAPAEPVFSALNRAVDRSENPSAALLQRAAASAVYGRWAEVEPDLDRARAAGLDAQDEAQFSSLIAAAAHLRRAPNTRAIYMAALERMSDADVMERGRMLVGLGMLARHEGNLDEAAVHFEQARACSEAVQDWVNLCRIERSQAHLCQERGDLARSETHLQRALDLAHANGDTQSACSTLLSLALTCRCFADLPAALSAAEEALEAARSVGSQQLESHALYRVATTLLALHDLEGARTLALQGLAVMDRIGDVVFEGYTLLVMAQVAFLQGKLPRTLHYATESAAKHHQAGGRVDEGMAQAWRALALHAMDRKEEAAEVARRARELGGGPLPAHDLLELALTAGANKTKVQAALRDAERQLHDVYLQEMATALASRANRADA
jgi:DNA-binding winged helix-turn-helix (wHTH) protein/tetratricopeptide (TPR) repeat protein